ncbi:MAG: CHAD domain-containing protein [Aureliella sp.]
MVAIPDKFVERVSADETLADIAARALRGRLESVATLLPSAAASHVKDTEAVHQLRVWTRRSAAALELFDDQLPRRQSAWMKKQLKRIRRAANPARDCDVLIARLRKGRVSGRRRRWLGELREERHRAQDKIIAVHQRLDRKGKLQRRIRTLLKQLRSDPTDQGMIPADCFCQWAHAALRLSVERFFDSVPSNQADQQALHQFRIRGKELRYAIELLAGAFPAELRTQVYPEVATIQDRLGELNDLAVAQQLLREKAHHKGKRKAQRWRRLLAEEQAKAERAYRAFWNWFTPETIAGLRARMDSILV